MTTITFNISKEIMQRLQSQNKPLQSILIEALNEYLGKQSAVEFEVKSLTRTKTWELCGKFKIKKEASNGQKMADILKKIALKYSLSGVNPQDWQRKIRGDR